MNMVTTFLAGSLLCFVIAAVCSLPVLWLWNGLMPDIFGLKEITWMQALGLSCLCSLLFKSSGSSK